MSPTSFITDARSSYAHSQFPPNLTFFSDAEYQSYKDNMAKPDVQPQPATIVTDLQAILASLDAAHFNLDTMFAKGESGPANANMPPSTVEGLLEVLAGSAASLTNRTASIAGRIGLLT